MPGTLPRAVPISPNPLNNPVRHECCHFIEEEADTQRGEGISSRSTVSAHLGSLPRVHTGALPRATAEPTRSPGC